MMTRFTILSSILLLVLSPYCAWACSCIPNNPTAIDSVREHYEKADLVFLGKVEETQTDEVQDGEHADQIQTTTHFVLNSWKGEKSNRILTRINVQCCVCGYPFAKDQIHLIFAYEREDGSYSTSICSMSMPEALADETIVLLDEIVSEQ